MLLAVLLLIIIVVADRLPTERDLISIRKENFTYCQWLIDEHWYVMSEISSVDAFFPLCSSRSRLKANQITFVFLIHLDDIRSTMTFSSIRP